MSLILIIPTYFAFHLESIFDETNAEVTRENEALSHLDQMNTSINEEHVALFEMAYELTPEAIDTFMASAKEADERSSWILGNESDEIGSPVASEPMELAAIKEWRNLHSQVRDIAATQVIPQINNPQPDSDRLKAAEDLTEPAYQRLTVLADQINSYFIAGRDSALLSQIERRQFASEIMWASMIASLIAGLLVAVVYARHLLNPVLRLASTMLKTTQGDLSQRVQVNGNDELAQLGNSFNSMAAALEQRNQELMEEKARIRSIHQSIGDGIVVVDRGGVIVSLNPAAERMLGRTAKELENTTNAGIPELQRVITGKIPPANMVKCWEAKNCAKADCPAHGSSDPRCWLHCGTFCYNEIQGTFKQKRDACERCDVFVKNAVIEFSLNVNGFLLSGRAVPILDDLGQEEGKTIVLHDVTDLGRSKEAAESSAAQLAILNSVSRAVAGSLELDSIFTGALERMIGGTMAAAAFIHTWEAGNAEMTLAASQGLDDSFRAAIAKLPPLANAGGCPGHVIESGQVVLENHLDQLGIEAQPGVDAGFLSYIGAPLVVKKQFVGVISLLAAEPGAFVPEDKRLLSMIGSEIGLAIDNSNLFLKTVAYAHEEQVKSRIVAILAANFEIEKSIDKFAAVIHELIDFERLSVVVLESSAAVAKVILPTGVEPALEKTSGGLGATQGSAIEWVTKNRRAFVSPDITKDIKFQEQANLINGGFKSQMNIPLIAKGKAVGSLNLASMDRAAYNDETVRLLQPIADQLALAIANQKLFEEISLAKKEWETTFDSASEGIVMVSQDHRISRINETAATMLGSTVKDLLGRRCYEVIHGASKVPASCLMRQAHATSSTSTGEQQTEDGSTLEVTVDSVYTEKGVFAGAIHFLRDITEAKKLRHQLLQSEKMVAVGELVAGVAHEINNPLTGVTGYAQLLLSRELDEQTRRDVELINHEAERASKIVRHLLSFARKHEPERRVADINQIVSEALDLKAYDLRVNNISSEIKLAEGLPATAVDSHQLQQVFLNLIVNAEQAMLAAAPGGRLLISTASHGGSIRITFSDSGPGIPSQISDRIFDPFFTTKDVGSGTGLGLSICYGIIEEHGGKIWVDRAYEDGARFVVDLPVDTAILDDTTTKVDPAALKPAVKNQVGKVLLVDDEAAIRDIVRKLLKRAGHSVDTARNGQVALKMLKQRHYDCVITDVKMPGVDGTVLHQSIRDFDPRLAGTFIFISGDTVSPETSAYLSKSKRPYLAKPFKFEELESLLQRILAGKPD